MHYGSQDANPRPFGGQCVVKNVSFVPRKVTIQIVDGAGALMRPSLVADIEPGRVALVNDFAIDFPSTNDVTGSRSCVITVDGPKDSVRGTFCLRDATGRCEAVLEAK